MKGKKAATEWTMAKLLTLVLAVLVMVLVIYGVSTGGFEPLKNRILKIYDEVLILFNLKSPPPTTYDCKPRLLKDYPPAASFMNTLGLTDQQKAEISFTLCDDWCALEKTGDGDYRINFPRGKSNEAVFQKKVGEKYSHYPFLKEDSIKSNSLSGTEENIQRAKFYRELYHKVITEVIFPPDLETLKEFYNKRYTKRILIWTNGDSEDYASYFVWQNGWTIYYAVNDAKEHNFRPDYIFMNRAVRSYGYDFESSLEVLIKRASEGLKQEDVYFGLGSEWRIFGEESYIIENTWSGIDVLAGRDGLRIDPFESSLEIETSGEKQRLRDNLCKKRAELLVEVYPTEEEFDKIRLLPSFGTKFEFKGKQYQIEISGSSYSRGSSFQSDSISSCGYNLLNYPVISITEVGGEERYGLEFMLPFDEALFVPDKSGFGLDNNLPLKLMKENGETKKLEPSGDYRDYQLIMDEDFEYLSKMRRIKDFLVRTCSR